MPSPSTVDDAATSLRLHGMPDGAAPGNELEPPLLSAVGLSFSYPGDGKPTLGKTDLELRRGSVVGLFGQNACGKTTLARCLCDRLRAATGTVTRSAAATSGSSTAGDSSGGSGGSGRAAAYMLALVVFAVAGAAAGALWPKLPPRQQRQILQTLTQLGEVAGLGHLPAAGMAAFLALTSLVCLTELVLLLLRCLDEGSGTSSNGSGGASTPAGVSFITSEDNPANQLPQDATLETTLTALLPASKFPDAESRREEAIRLMEVANFQRYNQTTVSSSNGCLSVFLPSLLLQLLLSQYLVVFRFGILPELSGYAAGRSRRQPARIRQRWRAPARMLWRAKAFDLYLA